MAIRADSSSREPTNAVGVDLVSEFRLMIGMPAASALSTAGELASTSHGFRMMTSTRCAMKPSTCWICRSALRWASLTISLTPNSPAFASIASLSITMNSLDRFSSETPTTTCLPPPAA